MATKKGVKGVSKGGPSGLVVSLLLHAAAFLLAGALVVFTVTQKKEQHFEPPVPRDRPKMKLKKPKVKVKKNAKPKTTSHIVTKVQNVQMPDIALPEMSAMSDGLGSGVGGFEELGLDLGEVTTFGSSHTIGNDLVGTFYDTKRDRSGRPIIYSQEGFEVIINKFVKNKCRPSTLARYYQSPNKRYTTTIMMPNMLSVVAPYAFDERDTVGCLFLIHYKGELVHKDGIKFRFWGESGDVLFVLVDGEVVLNACYPTAAERYNSSWLPDSSDHRKYPMGYVSAAVGNLVELEPGVPRKIDIVVGESPGGGFGAYLLVEEEGEKYEKNYEGTPLLPIFKTAPLTLDQMDAMYEYLVPNEVLVTNGPTFCDYETRPFNLHALTNLPPQEVIPEPGDVELNRVWTMEDGTSTEAEYVIRIADQAVFKFQNGKQKKIPFARLSEADQRLIELAEPPELRFDFAKQTDIQPAIDPGPYMAHVPEQRIVEYVFTAKIYQMSTGNYPHELTAEFFAIGEEVDGDNYVLLDRQTSVFMLEESKGRKHMFSGDMVEVWDNTDYYHNRRGVKYGGYLITVKDERGKTIAHGASHDWLFDKIENIKRVPVGKHFDKGGYRCFPPRQKPRPRN